MNRLIAGAALGAMLLGPVAVPADADPLGEPVLIASATSVGSSGEVTGNVRQVVCRARVENAVAASTGITCNLSNGGVLVQSESRALPGNATAATVTIQGEGDWHVCWEAQAILTDLTHLQESTC